MQSPILYQQQAACQPGFHQAQSESQELQRLKTQLMMCAKSAVTAAILSTAAIPEIRGIKRLMDEIDINPTIMEWATVVYQAAIHHPVAPSPRSVHQWKNALLFVHERLKANGAANPGEAWMLQNEQVVLSSLVADFRSVVETALRHLARHPPRIFFNGMLCFASHFAKHAVCLRMGVEEYLQKAEELLQQTPFVEYRCHVHKKLGWALYVTQEHGISYIKTLHLKAAWHARYLQKL